MTQARLWGATLIGILLLGGSAILSLSLGIVGLELGETFALFDRTAVSDRAGAVICSIDAEDPRRHARGAALATVGAVMQAILVTPLQNQG